MPPEMLASEIPNVRSRWQTKNEIYPLCDFWPCRCSFFGTKASEIADAYMNYPVIMCIIYHISTFTLEKQNIFFMRFTSTLIINVL